MHAAQQLEKRLSIPFQCSDGGRSSAWMASFVPSCNISSEDDHYIEDQFTLQINIAMAAILFALTVDAHLNVVLYHTIDIITDRYKF